MSAGTLNHSVEAEQSVLGAVLLDNEALYRVVDLLQAASFWHRPYGAIFDVVSAMVQAGQPVDVVTLFEELRARGATGESCSLAHLNQIVQSVPSATNIRRYAQVVADHAAGRSIADAAGQAVAIAGEAGAPVEKLERIHAVFGALNRLQVRKEARALSAIAAERIDHYEQMERGEVTAGWPTGFRALDALLTGGLRPGCLYVLAARPKVGKSSLAMSVAFNLATQGLPTLFCSMEMPETEVADRAVSMAGRVDYTALLTGGLHHGDGWSRVTEAMERIAALPLHVDDTPSLSLAALKAKMRTRRGLRVLVVDYLQLMVGAKGEDTRNAQLEAITRGLKAMAKTEGMAVIALSQLNREVEKRPGRRPQLSDLRDSGSIEQDADAVMLLWPVREEAPGGRRIIGLAVEANRQGAPGTLALDFDGSVQRWDVSSADLAAPVPRRRTDDDL